MLKQKYFLTGIFILSAERQPIKLAWRKIVWLQAIGLQIRLNGEYFSDHQIMQRSDFQGITGMVRSTAMIHIRRLRQEGKPQNIGIPSQPIYVPAPGFYGKSRDYQPVK